MGCESCGAIKDASAKLRKERHRNEIRKVMLVCGTIALVALMACITMLVAHTISEQQDTIRFQYQALSDLLYGAEIVTEEYSSEATADDGGTAIVGDNNMLIGGDMNGDS